MRATKDDSPVIYQPYIGRLFSGSYLRTCILSNIWMDDSGEHYEEATPVVVNSISINMTPFKTISFWIGGDFFRDEDFSYYDFVVMFYKPGRHSMNIKKTNRRLGGYYHRIDIDVSNINEHLFFGYRFIGYNSRNRHKETPYVAGVNRIDFLV